MKATLNRTLILLLLISPLVLNAQKAKRKSVKANITHYPQLPINDINSYTIKIYPGENSIEQDYLKMKQGIGTKLQNFQDKVNKVGGPEFYSFKEFQSTATGADVFIEISFGKFNILGKKEVEWKIPCTYKGAELKKENIMECPAYYYEIAYRLPVIYRIVNNAGVTLLTEKIMGKEITAFGKSELAGYLKKDELAAAYAKPGVTEGLGMEAMVQRLEAMAIPINVWFYYYDEATKIDVATGAGSSYDYPELDKAQQLAADAYASFPAGENKLKEAVGIWETALLDLNKEDKKAKVGRNLGMGLNENLATAYALLNNYDNALRYIDGAIELQQLMTNKTREPVLYEMKKRLASQTGNSNVESNKAAMTGASSAVGLILTEARVKQKDSGYKYLNEGLVFEAFNKDYLEFTGKAMESATATEQPKSLGELLGGDKSYKERIMVLGNNTQLILNDVWGDKLDALPEEICDLTELTQLNLTDQPNVTTLPACIGNLTNLKKLNLWNNGLSSLPAEIGNLSKLENLDVSNNNLTELPLELKNCKNLKKLVVKGNNISNLDEITAAFPKLKVK